VHPRDSCAVAVVCNNAQRLDIAPQGGDFNQYGGLYRDAWLIVTDDTCITPLYYGSTGVLISQTRVDERLASIRADIHLSSLSGYAGCEIDFCVLDASGAKVVDRPGILVHGDRSTVVADIADPHLWNGRQDPYLYKAVTVLKKDGREIDRIEENIGLRYFSVDPEKGFFLNGKHLKLHGVCRHQDWADIAVALKEEHHLADFDFFDEMGVDALRLAHYPQAKRMFQEADRRGYVVWEEIPFVGGYVNSEGFHENLRQQLLEMIIQNYNHPSICFWGIFNEIHGNFDAIVDELNSLAHEVDPFRLTVSATDQEGSYNLITDGIGWNKYYGWYTDSVADFGPFMDDWHARHPQTLLAISEYGGGASVQHHVAKYDHDEKAAGFADPFHPEERQVWIHRHDWKEIAEREFVWGSFIWNMFDFASQIRREGDTRGQNDKGLVTRDRKTRKDAFYFYKANWNKSENTVHICSKAYTEREENTTDVIVFTTAPSAKLYVNGKLVGSQKTDAYATLIWKDVKLASGANEVVVKTAHGDDSVRWTVK
jgi:beta-galactosidase